MTPEKIVTKSAHALDNFEPIDGQPFDTNLTRLWEAVAPILLQIPYDKTGAVHNLIGLIQPETAYVARYGEAFPDPTRVEAYDHNIDNDAMAVVRARLEAANKAKRADRAYYETARRETTQFVLAVIADTWVCELRDRNSLYTKVGQKELFSQLQAGCTGQYTLDLLVMHNKIQRYQLEVEGIPEYINMLDNVQRQAGRTGGTIVDETLLLFVSTTMLTSKRFLRTNNNWEELVECDKTWSQWKTAYKRAHAKARVKAQANNDSVKFGAANSSASQETANPPSTMN